MPLQVGDKIPSVKLKRLGASGMEEFDTAQELAGKKVVLWQKGDQKLTLSLEQEKE